MTSIEDLPCLSCLGAIEYHSDVAENLACRKSQTLLLAGPAERRARATEAAPPEELHNSPWGQY